MLLIISNPVALYINDLRDARMKRQRELARLDNIKTAETVPKQIGLHYWARVSIAAERAVDSL